MSGRERFLATVVLLLLALGMMCESASAQIEVAPTRVLLTTRNRSQEITIHNPTSDPVEVTTDLGFKLIRSDSLGRMSLDSIVTPEEARRSCREWIRIFPRKFIVAPGSSRSVRVLILPPDSIADGEYWGRAIFGCLPMKQPSYDTSGNSVAIRTNLMMRIEFDIPVIFRKGPVETGIIINNLTLRPRSDGTLLLIDLASSGNAAYRGTLTAVLQGADDGIVGSVDEQFTVEFTLRKGLMLPKLSPGRYRLGVESKSVKRGGASDAVIPAPTVRNVYELTVMPDRIDLSLQE